MTAPLCVGVDIGGTKTAVAVVDVVVGHVVDVVALDTLAPLGASQLHDRIAAVLAAQGLRHDIGGVPVGFGLPELVSPEGEVLTDVVIPGLAGDLRATWSDLGISVVEADVRAAATAEAQFGMGRDLDSFVYISVGTGISCCLILEGRPWAGHHGAALLLGSGVLVDRQSLDAGSGQSSLEDFAGGPAIVLTHGRAGGAMLTTPELLAAAERDPRAGAVVTAAGRALGLGIAELVNLLDPQTVVVGGGLGSTDGPYWEAAVDAAREHIWAEVSREVPIEHAAAGPNAGVIGAALIASRC